MSSLINLSAVFGDRAWYQSLTFWGLAFYVAGSAFIGQICGETGIVSDSVCSTLQSSSDTIGVVLTALGIRRATNTG